MIWHWLKLLTPKCDGQILYTNDQPFVVLLAPHLSSKYVKMPLALL